MGSINLKEPTGLLLLHKGLAAAGRGKPETLNQAQDKPAEDKPTRPKRPLNSYFLFMADYRAVKPKP